MSASLYTPDQVALDTQTEPWSEAFRTQRDVALLVPINYHTVPAVSLTAVCFSHNQYENASFQKCFSNLLAIGLRRFNVDVYWDARRSEWSLCPAEIPPSGPDAQTTASEAASVTTSAESASTGNSERNARRGSEPTTLPVVVEQRQDGSISGSTSALAQASASSTEPSTSASESSSTLATPIPSLVTFPSDSDNPLIQIGSYNCTSSMTLGFLTGIFEDFLDATSTTTDATFTFLLLNIHAASSWAAPDNPAQQPRSANLPSPGNLISDIMKGNLSDELYTPAKLQEQRANLNNSWFDVPDNNLPEEGYYQTSKDRQSFLVTGDGWPTEAFMEFKELYRLISSFGTIDPQMSEYNISADTETVFAPGILRSNQDVTIAPDGSISSGCLFAPAEESITSNTNSSWAVGMVPSIDIGSNPDLLIPIPAVANLTSCGLSAFLNSTLANTTADQNILPYAAFTRSYLWSWAPGQPLNASTDDGSDSSSTKNRCVATYVSGIYPGRWRTVDCNDHHRVACKDPSTPYHWELSSSSTSYFDADSACASPFVFSVPHTALENSHLLAAVQANPSTSSDDAVFINLNDLDVADCWVDSVNGTCPYISTTDTNKTRVVVVPTVAAVLIFLLAALTFFVKCAANRREDKRGRRRRMVGGWEYEGVPS